VAVAAVDAGANAVPSTSASTTRVVAMRRRRARETVRWADICLMIGLCGTSLEAGSAGAVPEPALCWTTRR
jgi:hypothetical protein